MHTDDGPTDDHGAPTGNFNAVEHGLHMAPGRRFQWFIDDQRTWFSEYFETYGTKAGSDGEAARLASLAVIADLLERDLLKNGIVRSQADGNRRIRRATIRQYTAVLDELRRGLRSEGVSGNQTGPSSRDPHPGKHLLWTDTDG